MYGYTALWNDEYNGDEDERRLGFTATSVTEYYTATIARRRQ